jgi:hypothetical protein
MNNYQAGSLCYQPKAEFNPVGSNRRNNYQFFSHCRKSFITALIKMFR